MYVWWDLVPHDCSFWTCVHCNMQTKHNDVIKWKKLPRYWPFVRGIHRSPVDSPHKGQWCRALMFSLIYAWTDGWTNNRDTGDLRRHRAHYDVTLMILGDRVPKTSSNMSKWFQNEFKNCYFSRTSVVAFPLPGGFKFPNCMPSFDISLRGVNQIVIKRAYSKSDYDAQCKALNNSDSLRWALPWS